MKRMKQRMKTMDLLSPGNWQIQWLFHNTLLTFTDMLTQNLHKEGQNTSPLSPNRWICVTMLRLRWGCEGETRGSVNCGTLCIFDPLILVIMPPDWPEPRLVLSSLSSSSLRKTDQWGPSIRRFDQSQARTLETEETGNSPWPGSKQHRLGQADASGHCPPVTSYKPEPSKARAGLLLTIFMTRCPQTF